MNTHDVFSIHRTSRVYRTSFRLYLFHLHAAGNSFLDTRREDCVASIISTRLGEGTRESQGGRTFESFSRARKRKRIVGEKKRRKKKKDEREGKEAEFYRERSVLEAGAHGNEESAEA